MRRLKDSRTGALLLALVAGLLAASPILAKDTSPKSYSELKAELEQQLGELKSLIHEAEGNGIETNYAKVSVETIRAFQSAADWDQAHVEDVRRIFKTFKHYDKTDPTHADTLATDELSACLEVAAHAKAELRRQMGGQLKLQATPDFSKGSMKLTPGSYQLGGKPVFPYTLFWLPTMNDGMGDAFGRMGHTYMDLGGINSKGEINQGTLKSRVQSAREQSADNFTPLKFFWGHVAPPWLKKEHPELLTGGRNFTQYDMDSPQIRQWNVDLCRQFIPAMAQAYGDKPMIYMISNEPHFATVKGGWQVKNGLSQNTTDRWRNWLKEKYPTLAELNAAHGTHHTDFATVPSPFPINSNLRGGPLWYDWCRFNMDRGNDWFTFLKKTIQAHDGGRKEPVTIKVMGHHLSDSARDQGIDIEYLTGLQDVTGGDLRVRPYDAEVYTTLEGGLKARNSWTDRYAYEWISQALFLDFSKSLAPEKVFYDSEWHGFGAVHWRRFGLPRDYVRASLWHAFSLGMGAIEPWMWGRNPNGSFRESADQIGELATQPVALDAYGRVMKEINANAAVLHAAVAAKRTFMFYYLEESAIQDEDYASKLEASYESVKVLNHPMGMTTPTHLATLNPAEQIVIIPPSTYASDKSLLALEAFQKKGGRVIITDPTETFSKNEHGIARATHGIQPMAVIEKGEVPEMTLAFDKILTPLAPKPEVSVTFEDSAGKKAYGVLLQTAKDPDSGSQHLILNNSSRDPRKVTVDADTTLTDLLTGESLKSPFTLNSCDVKLIRIDRTAPLKQQTP